MEYKQIKCILICVHHNNSSCIDDIGYLIDFECLMYIYLLIEMIHETFYRFIVPAWCLSLYSRSLPSSLYL